MFQYYIIEIQKDFSGAYSHLVHYAFDTDADEARRKAESKYYEILSTAAISNLAMHSVILISAEGMPIMNRYFQRETSLE